MPLDGDAPLLRRARSHGRGHVSAACVLVFRGPWPPPQGPSVCLSYRYLSLEYIYSSPLFVFFLNRLSRYVGGTAERTESAARANNEHASPSDAALFPHAIHREWFKLCFCPKALSAARSSSPPQETANQDKVDVAANLRARTGSLLAPNDVLRLVKCTLEANALDWSPLGAVVPTRAALLLFFRALTIDVPMCTAPMLRITLREVRAHAADFPEPVRDLKALVRARLDELTLGGERSGGGSCGSDSKKASWLQAGASGSSRKDGGGGGGGACVPTEETRREVFALVRDFEARRAGRQSKTKTKAARNGGGGGMALLPPKLAALVDGVPRAAHSGEWARIRKALLAPPPLPLPSPQGERGG